MAISKVIIIALRNINAIGRAIWEIAGKKWKIDNLEIKIITFAVEIGVKSIVASYNEG